jgi:retinol-binding protein 3
MKSQNEHSGIILKAPGKIIIAILLLIGLYAGLQAQEKPLPLNSGEQELVIDSLVIMLNREYVFPEKAKEMGDLLQKNLKEGVYNAYTEPDNFGVKITQDLQSVSHDLHLRISYGPEEIAAYRKQTESTDKEAVEKETLKELSSRNFGFREVKIMDGNIGYLKLNSFVDTKYGAQTAAAAMQMMAYTDAVIIDLRDNGGGSPSMIQFITTYLLDDYTHLNSFYWRPTDELQQFWTLPYIPGLAMPDVDVYVLTSNRTFSAAEEFTYNLKNLKRAVIIGETTGGGAHPVDFMIINDNFGISMPKGRAINPITKTNWEGTGITPDYQAAAPAALDRALEIALDSLMRKTEDPDKKFAYQWSLEGLKAKNNPPELEESVMKKYAGTYEVRTLTFEDGSLYYQREGRPKFRMVPMDETTFMFEELQYFRLKIIVENGKAVAIEGIYDNGRNDKSLRTK